MSRLKKKLNLLASVFSDEDSFSNKIRGVDRLLYEKMMVADKAWKNKETPGQYAQYSYEIYNAIKEFRQKFVPWASLGVAVDVNSEDELRALPLNTPFFYKDEKTWRIKVK